ncbi:hypothetical protein SDC9_54249 [bioreactor metagenome]|uniref:Uncharacterized protein n=1 Tax=bioreactor metagenome TaxID=1076179 RepID=A0A644WWS9_9ZZZZ
MPEKFAAIYARQSLDKKDSLSIEGQIELCKVEVQGEFRVFEDRGFSGKNTRRPAFVQLLNEIEAGNVTRLVCYRLDRISRSILDFGAIWETLSRNDVEFVSVNEKFDTSTPVGRAMLYIIMVFAQLERETIAERVKDNYYQRVRKGAFPGGPAPYGMRIADKRSNGVCTLEPTEEIKVVKRIFELYAVDGMSLGKVAKRLSEEGIPAAKRATWDTISVYRVLRNPVYVKANADIYFYYKSKGLIVYNQPEEFTGEYAGLIVGKRLSNERKYTNMSEHLFSIASHPGIVDSDLFLICQYRLDDNKQIKNTGSGKYSWLSGLLHCSECGYSLKVMNDHYSGRLKLYCSGRTNFHACDLKHTEKVEDIEAYVEQDIMRYMKDTLENGVKQENINAEQNALKASLYQIEDKINNLVKAMAEGVEDTYQLQQVVRRTIGRWVNNNYRRRPMILPIVVAT